MKDLTDSMNRGFSKEDAERGFGDPGEPVSNRTQKRTKLKQAGLLHNDALMESEDPSSGSGISRGGFLKRNNYGDRF